MSQELRRFEMGDPLKILLSRETMELNRSCFGCEHSKEVLTPFGDTTLRCEKGQPYGKKCSQYRRTR